MCRENFLKKLGCLNLAALLLLSANQPLHATPTDREHTIKAGLIIKFIDFIEWPAEKTNRKTNLQYKLCILGENRFGNLFSHEKNKFILRVNVDNQEIKSCNIVFITDKNLFLLKKTIKKFENQPVLIISETKGYGKLGADINLIKKQNKIKFEINRDTLKKKGLKISSYLLNLAILVEGKSQ